MLISKTPLRISFFSGGSDMPSFYKKEDGAALSATIDKYIYVIAHKTPHLGVRIMYDSVEEFSDVEQMHHLITKETLKYYNVSKEITLASISDILSKGSGLGSSSAFTVGLINAIASYKWEIASKRYLADMACVIEMEKCGYPVGKQDQYAAAFGGFNLFEFHKNEEVSVHNLIIDKNHIYGLENKLLLVYSGRGRSANSILQKQQSAMNDKDKFNLVKRSRDKAYTGRDYLVKGQLDDFGNLLHEAWMDKKGVVSEISQDYFDVVYDKAMKAGALGGKLLGAGGGGFFLFYVPEEKREDVIEEITTGTECKVYEFKFSGHGSRITTSMID
jgi:D-glycero-alpha-D-manno-heptose-7-phosphate kinase